MTQNVYEREIAKSQTDLGNDQTDLRERGKGQRALDIRLHAAGQRGQERGR
jgi:hypothetical protein